MGLFNKEKLKKAQTAQIEKEATKRYNILLVDDEPANLNALSRILSNEYRILTANDGEEALEIVREKTATQIPIHLIISDQRMPKLTGVEFLKQTIVMAPKTIRMILTGFTDVEAIISAINDSQIYKFITKPIDPHELLLTVRRALEAYELESQNSQLQEENLRMKTTLEIARRLQRMLLPNEQELAQITGLDIVTFLESADEVGGDYYDVAIHEGQVKISIGDVTGHGLDSGILAIMVQTAVRTLLNHGETDPVRFINTLNHTIYGNVKRMNVDKSLTFSVASYHDGQLILSGQHEEVIVVHQGQIESVNTIDLGFPIGLEEDIATFITETCILLATGDIVVFYTDGITEAINEKGEFYGKERLCDVIQRHWQQSAEIIKYEIMNDLRQFIGKQKLVDDVALIVLKQK